MPLLTVITVVKDDVAGLDRTLASVAAQAPADVELVVVDGSTNRSVVQEALAAHPTLSPELLWQQPSGVYPAMNAGLERTSGDYVYFLNAGDRLAGDDVLARVCTLLEGERPLWGYGRVRFLDATGAPMPEQAWSYDAERRRLFARGRFPAHQAVVMSTACLRDQGGFDTSYRVVADYAAILRCAARARPAEWDLVLAEFQVGGLSTQQWRLAQAEFHRARREILQPRGTAAVLEAWDTARVRLATTAYRALWAPGRPLEGVVARVRPRR